MEATAVMMRMGKKAAKAEFLLCRSITSVGLLESHVL
jgi:hypothetical protein